MLKFKSSNHLDFPHVTFSQQPLQLSPVPVDSDELIEAIENDAEELDNNWELEEYPDTERLDQFWTQVVRDLKSDPAWSTFSD